MKKTVMALASLSLALMIAGCGGESEADIVGEWSGHVGSTPSSDLGSMSPEMQKSMEQSMSHRQMQLHLKADGTFSHILLNTPEKGTWVLEGKTLTLTFTTLMGQDITEYGSAGSRPMTLTLSDDGRTMEGISSELMANMIYTKKDTN